MTHHGVRLSPHLADIYDMIARRGDKGASIEVLVGALYPGQPTKKARAALASCLVHINDRLEATDVRVRSVPPRSGVYCIVNVRRQHIKIGVAA
jgi:hypothetical protein